MQAQHSPKQLGRVTDITPTLGKGIYVEIVGQPVSLAARNYHSWQKSFEKNYALLSRIEIMKKAKYIHIKIIKTAKSL